MNNYVKQTPQTIRTVVMFGILASTFLPSNYDNAPSSGILPLSTGNNYDYSYRGIPLTHEPSKNDLTGYYPLSIEATFQAVVTNFFGNLSATQEPLGQEFEQVLFENLWDLYQS